MRITSPLGRLGLPGAIRIVAQVTHPPQVALGSVKFYVNDTLVGDDREGPPYAVEWTDDNPFEPTRIRVEASDALGNTVSDAIELAPFEIVETTGVSRVLLEATVMDKTGRFVGGLDAASFRVLENDEPQTIDLAGIESLPVTYTLLVDASQSMHARMEFVRTAAGRLADFLRPDDRIIVAPFAKSLGAITGPTADRDDDRRRRAGHRVQWRHGHLRRPHRGLAARAGHRSAARDRAHHRWLRRAQPGEDGGRARRGAVGARRGVRDRRRRRRRHLAQGRARAQADRRSRPAGGCSFRRGNRSCPPCTSSSRRTCSSAT